MEEAWQGIKFYGSSLGLATGRLIANIKRIRKERGFSQMSLSERCDTTANYISQIEMGRRLPSFEMIEQIAAALGVAPYRLFGVEEGADGIEPGPQTVRDVLQTFPAPAKKKIMARLKAALERDIEASFDPKNY